MIRNSGALGVLFVVVLCCVSPRPLAAATMGTGFTYQGRFMDGGSPAGGTYDFEFKLYDASTGGSQQGSTVYGGDVEVDDGYFTVELDFGSSVFGGDARWLQIGVRPGEQTGAHTTLAPRQKVTPGPYSLYSERTAGITASSGKIGIGTSSPSEKLHVSGGSARVDSVAVPMIMRETDQSLPVGLWRMVADGGQYRIDRNTAGAGDFSTFAAPFVVKSDGSVILDDGAVGISTWTPQHKFHVVSDSNPEVGLFECTGSAALISLLDSNTTGEGYAVVRIGDNLELRTSDVDRLVIKPNGDIGMGTWTPQVKLDVNGNIRCVDLTETSDEALKTDVEPLAGVLDKLEQVRAVSFRWNERGESLGGKAGARQIGVLAQDLEQAFPELVSTPEPVAPEELLRQYPEELLTPEVRKQFQKSAERTQYKAVSYSKLTAVLLEAVKELKAQNESLEDRIRALESKIQ